MSSSFRRTVEKIAEQAGEGDRRPCRRCDTPTPIAVLGQYAGRCYGCHEAWCTEAFAPVQPRHDTPQQADMRKRLKANRPTGQAMAKDDDVDTQMRDQAKREAARKVAEYAQRTGQPGTDTRTRAGAAR